MFISALFSQWDWLQTLCSFWCSFQWVPFTLASLIKSGWMYITASGSLFREPSLSPQERKQKLLVFCSLTLRLNYDCFYIKQTLVECMLRLQYSLVLTLYNLTLCSFILHNNSKSYCLGYSMSEALYLLSFIYISLFDTLPPLATAQQSRHTLLGSEGGLSPVHLSPKKVVCLSDPVPSLAKVRISQAIKTVPFWKSFEFIRSAHWDIQKLPLPLKFDLKIFPFWVWGRGTLMGTLDLWEGMPLSMLGGFTDDSEWSLGSFEPRLLAWGQHQESRACPTHKQTQLRWKLTLVRDGHHSKWCGCLNVPHRISHGHTWPLGPDSPLHTRPVCAHSCCWV